MNMLIHFLLVVLLISVCRTDCLQRTIKNKHVLILGLCAWLISIHQPWALYAVAYSAILLSAGVVLFHLGWVGGGDIKLVAALSLAVAPAFLPAALICMLLAGGVLAAAYWMKYRWWQHDIADRGLPYGVAICVGFYPLIILSGYYPY